MSVEILGIVYIYTTSLLVRLDIKVINDSIVQYHTTGMGF